MKNKRWFSFLIMILCLAMTGCGKKAEEESAVSELSKAPPAAVEKSTQAEVLEPEVWNPAVVQRQMLLDEGYAAGVIFIGYVDGSAGDLEQDKDYYQSIFEEQGYLEDFPYLAEIPNSNFVHTEYGQELYCIIPQDDLATVSVNQWIVSEENDFKGESGEVLYRSEIGSPILLKCNASEIVPDVEVLIVDNNGNQLHWCPSLSGIDGSVIVESADGNLYDFTSHANNGNADILDAFVGEFYDYYWSDQFEETLASMTAPIVTLSEESAAAYPQLSNSLNNNVNTRKTKLFNHFEELIPMAEEFYPEFSEYFTEFEAEEKAMIHRADSNVFSVLYNGYSYEGGAHGYYYCFGENYDTKTGELLKLEDVITDTGAIPALVQEQLNRFWDPSSFYTDLDLNQYFKDNSDSITWCLDYHGITFYFNPYEIAPYASGIQIATITFADHPEIFTEKYVSVPKSYGVQLNMETPFYYDIDSDGNLDEVIVNSMFTDDMIHVEHNIYINSKCYVQSAFENEDQMPDDTNEILSYANDTPHFIHMEDGRNYLIIENLLDSDFRTNTMYDLTDGTVKLVETIYSSIHTEQWGSDGYILKQAITDPYQIKLDTRTWVIGTADGTTTSYIDEEGYVYSYDTYYTFDPVFSYTALKDFKANLVDEYGNVGDEIVVKTGEKVLYYRTDASLFADFILSDGQIVRVDLQWNGGSLSIDGTYVEDLLDGVVFAG